MPETLKILTDKDLASGAVIKEWQRPDYVATRSKTKAEHVALVEVLKAMEENGVVLCIHGEEHGLSGERYISRKESAEEIFYRKTMPALIKKFPKLKIVCEHVTTAEAVKFVQKAGKNVAATITPQHLIYTVGDLLKGFKFHLYCLPLIKFDDDRAALRKAVTAAGQKKFFAGTDSAPHAKKLMDCGCAAGAYTGGIAPQLYAEAFELAGVDLSKKKGADAFKRFLCTNGPEFYGFKPSKKTFTLEKKPEKISVLKFGSERVVPLPIGMGNDEGDATLDWSIKA